MSEALYRQYRPKTFSEVIGQEVVTTILKNALKSGVISHAYLFTGPRGVGKTTIARLLAKAVNCLSPKNGEPDTKCRNCELMQSGRFIDLIEIDAASYTGVDNIREVIDHVKFSPGIGRYKVFIIDEVHMLSKAAFNALLKTLEEPPLHAIFVLATTEVQKVPATIISRSQRFDFRQISDKDIVKVLEKVLLDLKLEMSTEAKYLVARAASGSLRDALSILDQLRSFGSAKLTLSEVEEILGLTRMEASQKFFDFLIQGEPEKAVAFVKRLVFEGKDITLFNKNFLEYLRLVLLLKTKAETAHELGLSETETAKLAGQAKAVSGARLLEIIKMFLESYRESKMSPVPELPILSQILTLQTRAEIPAQEANKAPVVKEAAEAPAQTHAGVAGLDLGTIVDKWAEVLSRVKDYNHSLVSSLRLGRIISLDYQGLVVAFPYNFHKETVEARKNKIIVEQVLEDVYGHALKMKIVLERDLQSDATKPQGDLVSEAMKVLGSADLE